AGDRQVRPDRARQEGSQDLLLVRVKVLRSAQQDAALCFEEFAHLVDLVPTRPRCWWWGWRGAWLIHRGRKPRCAAELDTAGAAELDTAGAAELDAAGAARVALGHPCRRIGGAARRRLRVEPRGDRRAMDTHGPG